MSEEPLADMVHRHLRPVPDFPKPGILFQDITPLLQNPAALAAVIDHWHSNLHGKADLVAAVEARGFILGAPLAHRLGVGFVPLRKAGRLPRKTISEQYQLEYGSETLEVHADAIPKAARVVLVDDLLATGGTLQAALQLVARAGGRPVAVRLLVELAGLGGRRRLADMLPETAIEALCLVEAETAP